jgi:hypothetical protein
MQFEGGGILSYIRCECQLPELLLPELLRVCDKFVGRSCALSFLGR